ncbi:RWD domain-containing protein 3 isoform X2 [Motacilla alba alba]|uniref:RWD domain-containing protein 3 isoform X2 n=1 Tax=Motacilla alba alba TaxID=1094192 RepID=UPI0018D53549|nr:RWD domain-containing protein 3 isoform X2 [Motacilla alba alba]
MWVRPWRSTPHRGTGFGLLGAVPKAVGWDGGQGRTRGHGAGSWGQGRARRGLRAARSRHFVPVPAARAGPAAPPGGHGAGPAAGRGRGSARRRPCRSWRGRSCRRSPPSTASRAPARCWRPQVMRPRSLPPARALPARPGPGRKRSGAAHGGAQPPGQRGRSRSLLSLVACPRPARCRCWGLAWGAEPGGPRSVIVRASEVLRWERAGCSLGKPAEMHGISFRIQISVKEVLDPDVLLKLLFHLPVNYPSTLPDISVNSDQLTRAQCMDVREKLLEQAQKHLSEPMEYLILQKTSKVDVDSSGKKCKEKMMRVLCETELQSQHKRFLMFEVKEYSAPEELQKEFETAGLTTLFSEFVPPLLK